ncbi:MAG: 50S ribosomal protein L29 [Gammaproteobacteria bacterium]|jgi:large subunit ribosomal protein L29
MKASELRDKTQAQLQEELNELLREQFNLRMQKGVGQVARSSEFKRVRRDIARVQTVLNQTSGKRK